MSTVAKIVASVIGIYMISYLGPGAISALLGVTHTTWSAAEWALWSVMGVVAILGFVLLILKPAMEEGGGI